MSLFADHNLPFAVALGVMLVLSLVQVVGLGGLDVDADGDVDLDLDADGQAGMLGGLATLLGIGRVPFMVWLVLFLFLFAGLGVSIQALAGSLTGGPLDRWLAAILALGAALPATGVLVRPLARIMPRDETSAVGLDSLVGRRAQITTGRAAAGYPARAAVRDRHGQTHHVMVEPHEAGSEMLEGDWALLVRREGDTFYGVALAERKLSPVS